MEDTNNNNVISSVTPDSNANFISYLGNFQTENSSGSSLYSMSPRSSPSKQPSTSYQSSNEIRTMVETNPHTHLTSSSSRYFYSPFNGSAQYFIPSQNTQYYINPFPTIESHPAVAIGRRPIMGNRKNLALSNVPATIPILSQRNNQENMHPPFKSPRECKFCRNNGETSHHYKSHTLRNPSTGILVCPVLRDHVCDICGATGDDAHTRNYCPKLKRENLQRKLALPIELKRTRRQSDGSFRSSM